MVKPEFAEKAEVIELVKKEAGEAVTVLDFTHN